MDLTDTGDLRHLITRLFPGLIITSVAKRSGQRVVYFCTYEPPEHAIDPELSFRGACVVKASQGISTQGIAYIQREISILQSLNSANFPRLLHNDVFTEDPDTEDRFSHRLFVTFEQHIEGETLAHCKDRFKTEPATLTLLRELVYAMIPLWSRRPSIVHRDLKPDNIIIGPLGSPVIIDLGISREAEEEGVTLSAMPWGPCTPRYASPEQALNKKREITFKSDIFSLGVIAYELLSGEHPFAPTGTHSVEQVLERVLTFSPTSLYDLGISGTVVSRMISKMLAKEPYKRYRRPEYLLADIDKGLSENVI